MKKFVLSLALIVLIPTTGCSRWFAVQGNGTIKTETRELQSFDRVSISGSGTLEINIGQPTKIEITTDDNLLQYLQTDVSSGKLAIRSTRSINPTKLLYKVGASDVREIACSGATDVSVHGVNNAELALRGSGATDMEIDGQTKRLIVKISGAGDLDAAKLKAEEVVASISGSGNIDVHAEKTLKTSISGAGSVVYSGNPEVDQSISGSGSIRRKSK